jgi:acylphosphatase
VSTSAVHLVVQGLVQGVSYRASARDEARARGLRGWVRNLPNGDVEALAQGDAPQVEAFVAWCRRGPAEARVEGVTRAARPVDQRLGSFEVLR